MNTYAYRVARRVVGEHLSEDVSQEAWILMQRGYTETTATRYAIYAVRRGERMSSRLPTPEGIASRVDPEGPMDRAANCNTSILDGLTEQEQTVAKLLMCGDTQQYIADCCKISQQRVSQIISGIRSKLLVE